MRLIIPIVVVLMVMIGIVMNVCPNGCSGHGSCVNSVCECYSDSESGEFYIGNDCSLRGCPRGNPFSVVPSVSPSLSSGSSYYSNNRELSSLIGDLKSNRRELLATAGGFELKLDENLDDGTNKLWKVSGIEEMIEFFPKSGGIIECEFTKGDSVSKDFVSVITHTSTHAYVLFNDAVTSNNDYDSIKCNDIIRMRNDLSQIKPNDVAIAVDTPPAEPAPRLLSNNKNITRQISVEIPTATFTWSGFGKILVDMGLLKQKTDVEGKITYENNNIRFACYTPPTTGDAGAKATEIIGTGITTYDGFKAVKDPIDSKDVEFTKTDENSKLPKAGDICLCLMNDEGNAIGIEESEIYENIRYDATGSSYKIGKYKDADKDNHIAAYNVGNKKVTVATDSEDDKLYFSANRYVYATVLRNGIFIEVRAKLSESGENIIATLITEDYTSAATDIILPYLRSSPISQLTELPTTTVAATTASGLYKAYYFAENLLYSLKKEGGILECKYTNKDGSITTPVEVDVKGIIKDSKKKVIIYSYIEVDTSKVQPSSEIDNNVVKGTFKYERIKIFRSDLTTYKFPVTFEIQSGGRERRSLTPPEITWTGFGPILKDMGFKGGDSQKVNFACLRLEDKTKEIKPYETTLNDITQDSDAEFTFTAPTGDAGTYLCFMISKINDKEKTEVKLEESDIKDKIVYEGVDKDRKYYYGEYILSSTTTYKKEKDETEVIILNKNSEIKIDTSTITIPDMSEEIENILKTKGKFSLKLLKKDNNYEEDVIQCEITNIAPPPGGRRLLQTSKTITATCTGITINDIPFYVLYLNIPQTSTETPTAPQPITEIRNIDVESNFYEISNFLEYISKDLPLIGGKIECKMDDVGRVGLIDVVGVKNEKSYYKFDKKLNVGRRRILESGEILLKNIRDCKIINIRKDMSLYNVMKLEKDKNYNENKGIINWFGYGEIFDKLTVNVVCYNPSKDSNKEMKIYENIKTFQTRNIKNNKIKDLNIEINDENKPVYGDVCYMLSDVNGNNKINLENSELFEFIRKESNKYYFGKSVISESGKSDETKSIDGSVKITIDKNAIVTTKDDDSRFKDPKNSDKVDLFDLNEPSSPSLFIPSEMIGSESEKMVVIGNTVELIFLSKEGIIIGIGEGQILKIEKDELGRYKIILSNPIYVPVKEKSRRLRSLATTEVESDTLVTINWKSEGSTHISMECSGQGICDRSVGLCKCYNGFSGSACERLDCPSNCNGNGRCVSLSELLSNAELKEYKGFGNKHESKLDDNADKIVKFDNQVYGCLCDKRHRGYDCSLMECPSDKDPEGGSNDILSGKDEYRDCSGRGICNYSSGICECFDGFNGEGCQYQSSTM